MIVTSMEVEKIYLLGEYPSQLESLGHESDLLVLLKGELKRPMDEYESLIHNRSHDMIPVHSTVLPIDKVNKMIAEGHEFFINSCKSEKLIYDAGSIDIVTPSADVNILQPSHFKKEYTHFITNAEGFLAGAVDYEIKQEYPMACFMLHQAVEQALSAIMIPLMQYRLKTHNLGRLMRIVRRFSKDIYNTFPKETKDDVRRFHILQRAYIHGRYRDTFEVTQPDTAALVDQCASLIKKVKTKYYVLTL